ncbi:MAG: carboxypeptidase-like regulatory domain-containing protein [Planctomycetota bacterium]
MNSGIRHVVVAALAFGAGVAAQRDLAAWPADPLGAIAKLPVAAVVADGTRVCVRSAKGAPVAGADVVVADLGAVDPPALAFLDAWFGRERSLVLASARGTRYRTDAEGRALVAIPERGIVVAHAGGEVGLAMAVGGVVTVRLEARDVVNVEVFAADGRLAPRVPVSVFASGSHFFSEVVLTDPAGRARLRVRRVAGSRCALVVAEPMPSVAVPADYFDGKPELLRLDLPPLGRAHVRGAIPPDVAVVAPTTGFAVPPSRYSDAGAWFDHVAVGTGFGLRFAQRLRDEVTASADGPNRAGAIVELEAPAGLGPALVVAARGRLLDAEGRPVANRALWCWVQSDGGGRGVEAPRTDANGRFVAYVMSKFLREGEVQLLFAPLPHLASGDTPVAVKVLTYEGQDVLEFGDLRLQEEPVMAAGRVVDVDGSPVAGVQVAVRQVVGNADPQRSPWWQTCTGADGSFTLRGFDRGGELRIGAERKDLVGDDIAAAFGATGLELRVARHGSLRVSFADGEPPRCLALEARGADGKVAAFELRGGHVLALWPGLYDLEMQMLGRSVLRIPGVEVRSGAVCDDPRVAGIDWRRHLQELTVHLVDPAGKPVGGNIVVSRPEDPLRCESFPVYDDGTGWVVFLEGMRLTAESPDRRPAPVLRGFDPVEVRMIPRARLRVTIAEGADLPECLVVREGDRELADDVKDGTELRPSGSGAITLVFGERALQARIKFRELWRQEVRVRDDDLLQVLTLEPDTGGK